MHSYTLQLLDFKKKELFKLSSQITKLLNQYLFELVIIPVKLTEYSTDSTKQ